MILAGEKGIGKTYLAVKMLLEKYAKDEGNILIISQDLKHSYSLRELLLLRGVNPKHIYLNSINIKNSSDSYHDYDNYKGIVIKYRLIDDLYHIINTDENTFATISEVTRVVREDEEWNNRKEKSSLKSVYNKLDSIKEIEKIQKIGQIKTEINKLQKELDELLK